MKISRFSLPQYLDRLARDERAISAVEFAMLLPLMITMYLGTVEVSQAVGINRKVTITAHTVADLASQVTTIGDTDMTNLLAASAAVIAPYDASKLKVTVSGVQVDNNGVAKIAWSDTLNGSARTLGSTVTIPAALNSPGAFLVWGEVSYNYVPTIGYVITGAMNLSDQLYMGPRLGNSVARTHP
jgi:Flp pilus assembly protein TadG